VQFLLQKHAFIPSSNCALTARVAAYAFSIRERSNHEKRFYFLAGVGWWVLSTQIKRPESTRHPVRRRTGSQEKSKESNKVLFSLSVSPASACRIKKPNWRLTVPYEQCVVSVPRIEHAYFDLANHFPRFRSRNLSWAGPSHLGPLGDKCARIASRAAKATWLDQQTQRWTLECE
jgi:hypothetical protein